MLIPEASIIVPATLAAELMRCLPKYVRAEVRGGRPVSPQLLALVEDCRKAVVISATTSAGTSVRQEHGGL